jgi:hypothetical protein
MVVNRASSITRNRTAETSEGDIATVPSAAHPAKGTQTTFQRGKKYSCFYLASNSFSIQGSEVLLPTYSTMTNCNRFVLAHPLQNSGMVGLKLCLARVGELRNEELQTSAMERENDMQDEIYILLVFGYIPAAIFAIELRSMR